MTKAANPDEDLGQYPNGVTISMVNYANYNQTCADASLTTFLQYLGFFLLLEAEKIKIKVKNQI